MKNFWKDEKGVSVVVEATFIFPVLIIITVLLFFLTIYSYSKISLQKTIDDSASGYIRVTSNYQVEKTVFIEEMRTVHTNHYRNPYDKIIIGAGNIESLKLDLEKKLGKNKIIKEYDKVKVAVTEKNYIVYRELEISAKKTFKLPVSLALIGISDSKLAIYAHTKVPILDPDEFIRNVDLAFDATGYLDEKLGISDSLKPIFEKLESVKKYLE